MKSKRGSFRSLIALSEMVSADSGMEGICWAIEMPLRSVLNCSLVSMDCLNGPAVGEQTAQRVFSLHGRGGRKEGIKVDDGAT